MKTENLNNLPIELHHEIYNVMQYQFLNVAVFWVVEREATACTAVISSFLEEGKIKVLKNEKQVHWQRTKPFFFIFFGM